MKAAFLRLFEVNRSQTPKTLGFQCLWGLGSIFSDFSKKSINFKRAQKSRISSPEAVKRFMRQVFACTLILKLMKKNIRRAFLTHQIPSNTHFIKLFSAQNAFFRNFKNSIWIPYEIQLESGLICPIAN